MKPRRPSPWVVAEPETGETRIRLVCLPYAGGNSSLFRSWSRSLPSEVQVCSVQLPGRHRRLGERPMTRMAPLVDALEDVIARLSDVPLAFFGQCSGALIGYELARKLRRTSRGAVRHLFIASCPAPELYTHRTPLHALPDEAFFAALERMGGTPSEVLATPELRAFVAPALRADLELVETYAYVEEEPLSCPITTFHSSEDRMVTEEEMRPWQRHTRSEVVQYTMPGTHYILDQSESKVLEAIERALSAILDEPPIDAPP
jgi:medium-chain acyl-[acyl-carrier-protein] hydrolase